MTAANPIMETLELLKNSEPSCKLLSVPVGVTTASIAEVKSSATGLVLDLASDSAKKVAKEPHTEADSTHWSVGTPLLPRGNVSEPDRKPRRVATCDSAEARVKQEVWKECVLCASRTEDTFDIYLETTCCGQVTLCAYICKVANLTLEHSACSKFACSSCYHLINLVEQAELEFLKQREVLLDIISHNAALAYDAPEVVEYVKVEHCKSERGASSEDDEPLACIKPALRNRSKVDYTQREPSPLRYRNFSSDEEFFWKLETKDERSGPKNKFNSCNFKKSRSKRSKRSKLKLEQQHEPDEKHPSDLLVVELQEPSGEDTWKRDKSKKENVKPKQKKDKCFKLKRRKREPKESNDKNDLTCTRCNRTFSKRCYYDYHMARHNNTHLPFICEVCGKGFKNRKMCDVHVLMHQGIADYKCIPCNKLFPTKFAFLRHDKIHKGKPKYQCDLCGKSFIHQSSFRMHNLAHAGIKRHSCDVCGLALLSSSHLSRHKRIHSGEKRYECDQCGKKFSEKYNMQSHMRTHMKGKERAPSPANVPGKRKRWFRCEMCEEKFDRLFKLECHLVDDHNVHLKKGRPKPRNTMKKMQRAQQAAASVVNAIATAMSARVGQLAREATAFAAGEAAVLSVPAATDVKPSVSSLDEQLSEGAGARVFKTSPHHHSMSPATSYMSPPPPPIPTSDTAESTRAEHQSFHQQAMRSAGAVWPHMAYMGAGYLGRMPDYTQQ